MRGIRIASSSALACALVAAAANGCGGGGSKPHILSFTASPSALPKGGGPVTFQWSVAHGGHLTIDPFVGAVTGTATTFVVTTGATFTLTAHDSNGTDRAETTVTVGAPFTVTGVVTDALRGNVQEATVFVLGQDDVFPAATGSDGSFVLDGVVAPYDLVVASPVAPVAFEYRGVTRPDPFVTLPDVPLSLPLTAQITHSASAAGTVTGTTFPLAPGFFALAQSFAAHVPPTNVPVDPNAGTYSCPTTWIGPTSIDQTCSVLIGDAPGGAPEYLFGARTETLSQNDAKTGETLAASSIAGTQVDGTFSTEIGLPIVPIAVFRLAPISAFHQPSDGLYANPLLSTTNSSYAWTIPAVPQVESYAIAIESTPVGTVQESFRLTSGTRDVVVSRPPVPEVPLIGTQIDGTTRFARDLPAGVLGMDLFGSVGGELIVMSFEPQYSLDDIGAAQLGILPQTTPATVGWQPFGWGIFGSMDEALDPAGATGDQYFGQGLTRSFQYFP